MGRLILLRREEEEAFTRSVATLLIWCLKAQVLNACSLMVALCSDVVET